VCGDAEMPRGVKRGRGGGMFVLFLRCDGLWLRGGCVECACGCCVAQMVATTRWLVLVMTVRV
jgi:hypothetical protein